MVIKLILKKAIARKVEARTCINTYLYIRMFVAIYLRYFKEYVYVRVALLRLYNTHLQQS